MVWINVNVLCEMLMLRQGQIVRSSLLQVANAFSQNVRSYFRYSVSFAFNLLFQNQTKWNVNRGEHLGSDCGHTCLAITTQCRNRNQVHTNVLF